MKNHAQTTAGIVDNTTNASFIDWKLAARSRKMTGLREAAPLPGSTRLLHRTNLPAHGDLHAARWNSRVLDCFIQLLRYPA